MDWAERIGRRVKLRDLHVMLAVAHMGSMSKAADRLAISHPVVSKTIADLEYAVGVQLFDRTARGVELTEFGQAILDMGVAVFDELRRGVRRVDRLKDPSVGDVSIGATEPVMCGLILTVMQEVIERYPRINLLNITGDTPTLHRALHDRRVDFVVSRRWRSGAEDELAAEVLFNEDLVVVAGRQNPLARRRKIKLAELMNEPWVLPERDNAAGLLIAEGFRSIGIGPLRPQTISNSIAIRLGLVRAMGFLTILPESTLHFYPDREFFRSLRVDLPMKPQPVEVVRLKHRMPSPGAETFLKWLHKIAGPLAKASV